MRSAEVVAVSAKTGFGLDDLRDALGRAAETEHRGRFDATRLWIDRVFTLKGVGTIATGTLWSGSIGAGDLLRLEPAGRSVRVRSVQVHDEAVERAESGQRVAVNLPAVERGELQRGDELVEPGHFRVSYRLDVVLEELEEIPPAVNVHLGTADIPARIARSGHYAQLRLAEPVVAGRGDRVVLRAGRTVGGGTVLDPAPPRGIDVARLELLEQGDPASIVRALVYAPVTAAELQARGLLSTAELAEGLETVRSAGDFYFSAAWLEELRVQLRERLAARAERSPLDPGLPLGELLPAEPYAPLVLDLLDVERRGGKAFLPGGAATLGDRSDAAAALEGELARSGAVKVDDRELAVFLEAEGRLKRLGDDVVVSPELYERGVAAIRTLAPITIASFRDALGISRRHAQLLLERYDADGLTRRVGDERVLRRAGREA